MKIYISHFLSGTSIPLEFDRTEKVINVKRKIQDVPCFIAEKQRLIFEDMQLDDNNPISDYPISNESIIYLHLECQYNNLSINEKGNMKWQGDFKDLQVERLELSTTKMKWSSPGGGCKLLETDGLTIRWYSTNGSLILRGEVFPV